MKKLINDPKSVLLIALLVGGAPFFPEPHLVGKIRWIVGGAVGMQALDWLDLFWHSWPLILLVRIGILHFRDLRVKN